MSDFIEEAKERAHNSSNCHTPAATLDHTILIRRTRLMFSERLDSVCTLLVEVCVAGWLPFQPMADADKAGSAETEAKLAGRNIPALSGKRLTELPAAYRYY